MLDRKIKADISMILCVLRCDLYKECIFGNDRQRKKSRWFQDVMYYELWFVRGVYLGMTCRERKADGSRLSCVMSCGLYEEYTWEWQAEKERQMVPGCHVLWVVVSTRSVSWGGFWREGGRSRTDTMCYELVQLFGIFTLNKRTDGLFCTKTTERKN